MRGIIALILEWLSSALLGAGLAILIYTERYSYNHDNQIFGVILILIGIMIGIEAIILYIRRK